MGKKRRKKRKGPPSRAKKMNREARLQAARTWLKKYQGKNIVSGYRKHFGVDWICAFKELEMLGIELDPEYVDGVLRSVASQIAARQRKKAERKECWELEPGLIEQDETFAYIIGYTAMGFPYGVTWEEWGELGDEEAEPADESTD